MPTINNTDGGTIFQPTPYEQIKNNQNKQRRIEHDEMLKDIENIKLSLRVGTPEKRKSIRRGKGMY